MFMFLAGLLQARKQRKLDAAIKLLAEHGLSALTIVEDEGGKFYMVDKHGAHWRLARDAVPRETGKKSSAKKPRHDPPDYYGYKGGFDNVTECQKCGCVSLYEDAHTVNPCKHCGGKVWKSGAAKWDGKARRWVRA